MKNFLINLLFSLLGNRTDKLFNIQYLFGASIGNFESRKKRWDRALARAFKDKDLLDFLFYQAESDKERIFQGKIRADLSRGARLRTLFIVYSMHRAHNRLKLGKNTDREVSDELNEETTNLQKGYKETTDVA